MVAVLLSILHPTSERIDGAGGDGGRDVQLRGVSALDFFEMKSQHNRVGDKERAQIKASLDRAALGKPDSWTLIIPIDHTPGELDWFNSLKPSYPFPLGWWGRTWLDKQMALHPQVPRYFLYSGADEATELLLQLRRDEKEFALGVEHVVSRVEGWIAKLQEVDPFWEFRLSRSETGGYTLTPVPRYRNAERDRPIQIHLEAHFPTTPAGEAGLKALEMAIDFGRPATIVGEHVYAVTVEGPPPVAGEYRGPIQLSSAPDSTFRSDVTLIAYASDGRVLSSLPMVFSERTVGVNGVEVTGSDRSGALRMRMRLRHGVLESDSDFSFKTPDGALPGDIAGTVRFLCHLRAGTRVGYRLQGSDKDAAGSLGLEMTQLVPDWYADFLDRLAHIQVVTHRYFPIPDTVTPSDVINAAEAAALLDGQEVTAEWSNLRAKLVVQKSEAFTLSLGDLPASFKLTIPHVLRICDIDLDVGPVELTLCSALIRNRTELRAQAPFAAGATVSAVLDPGDSDEAVLRRLPTDLGTSPA
jgi:hypothetical protein